MGIACDDDDDGVAKVHLFMHDVDVASRLLYTQCYCAAVKIPFNLFKNS